MALDLQKIDSVAKEYEKKDPADIVRLAIKEYSPSLAISFSGAEDVVLVEHGDQRRLGCLDAHVGRAGRTPAVTR